MANVPLLLHRHIMRRPKLAFTVSRRMHAVLAYTECCAAVGAVEVTLPMPRRAEPIDDGISADCSVRVHVVASFGVTRFDRSMPVRFSCNDF